MRVIKCQCGRNFPTNPERLETTVLCPFCGRSHQGRSEGGDLFRASEPPASRSSAGDWVEYILFGEGDGPLGGVARGVVFGAGIVALLAYGLLKTPVAAGTWKYVVAGGVAGAGLGFVRKLRVGPWTVAPIGAAVGAFTGALIGFLLGVQVSGAETLFASLLSWQGFTSQVGIASDQIRRYAAAGTILGGTLGVYWKAPSRFWCGALISAFWPAIFCVLGCISLSQKPQEPNGGGLWIVFLVAVVGVVGLIGGLIKITKF